MARLHRTESERKTLWTRIKDVALTDVGVLVRGMDEGSLEALEELLLDADLGVSASLRLVDKVEDEARGGRIRTQQEFLDTLRREVQTIVAQPEERTRLQFAGEGAGPTVFLVVGVNGVGKTTTIGKLAHRLVRDGHRVLLAAGDTFRAGAIDQLEQWARRVNAEFVGSNPGADPASVAFDAIDAAQRRDCDVVIIDTAGRLHTQTDLMTELKKVERVVGRKVEGGPHETLLVLDATVGQNALRQAKLFREAVGVSGLVLAKLDGSARGGIVVALREEHDLPVKLVGTGEGVEDLEPFDADAYLQQLLPEQA